MDHDHDLLEAFTRRYAKRTMSEGHEALVTDGDPLLEHAFAALGWKNPHIDPPATAAEPPTPPAQPPDDDEPEPPKHRQGPPPHREAAHRRR